MSPWPLFWEGDRVGWSTRTGEVYGTVRARGGVTMRVQWDVPGEASPLVVLSDPRLVVLSVVRG